MNCLRLAGLLSLAAVSLAAATPHETLAALLEENWQHQLRTDPVSATAIGDNRYNALLSDISPEAIARELDHDRHLLAALEQIDSTQLSPVDRLNQSLLMRSLKTSIAGAPFKQWEMPATQMAGPQDYAGLAKDMPFKTALDYENYLSRLRKLPALFQQTIANMRQGMRDGLMPPRYLLDKVAEEASDVAAESPAQSIFTDPARHFPEAVPAAERARLTKEINDVTGTQVLPAFRAFAKFVKDEYAPKGRTEFGIWALPDGAARYRQAIDEQTTTNSNPDDLHELGLKQVAEIEKQMLAIAIKQGYADLKTFNAHIFADKHLHGTSGGQILGLYARYTDQMYAKLPQYFGRLPKNKLSVVPMEAYRAPNAVPADYSPGAGDGSRPGRINVNEFDPTKRLLLNVEAIAYHEGIPGHHLQFSIAQELTDLPPFRKFASYNAFSEGWALYAETLAHEMGFYQDPYSEYGRLQNLMWRSVRLVVDTGVHSQHWSRQQMIDFFHNHTAMDDQNIETEVDRYIAWPAQALGYKLGEMTILKLRERARQQLGNQFDIRAFHDAVLEQGPLPLDVLEANVDRWIASKKRKGLGYAPPNR
jgi:uncharacterized protein (DUF885 family)